MSLGSHDLRQQLIIEIQILSSVKISHYKTEDDEYSTTQEAAIVYLLTDSNKRNDRRNLLSWCFTNTLAVDHLHLAFVWHDT